VPHAQRSAHEVEARAARYPDYAIHEYAADGQLIPAINRHTYYPVRYVGSGLRGSLQEEQAGTVDTTYAWVHLTLLVSLVATLLLRVRRAPLHHVLVGSALAHPRWGLSRSRARLISIGGVIGGLAGAGIDLLIQPEGEKTAIAIPLATSIVGLAVGAVRTQRDMEAEPDGTGATGPDAHLGALMNLDGDTWRVGLPIPAPIRVDASPAGTARMKTALHVPLLRARF